MRLEVQVESLLLQVCSLFQFQIGAIRSQTKTFVKKCSMFQFQIGAIRRLSRNDMYMITNLHSSNQVNFGFARIFWMSAVDLQSCKFSGRLTAVVRDCVYGHFLLYFVMDY